MVVILTQINRKIRKQVNIVDWYNLKETKINKKFELTNKSKWLFLTKNLD